MTRPEPIPCRVYFVFGVGWVIPMQDVVKLLGPITGDGPIGIAEGMPSLRPKPETEER